MNMLTDSDIEYMRSCQEELMFHSVKIERFDTPQWDEASQSMVYDRANLVYEGKARVAKEYGSPVLSESGVSESPAVTWVTVPWNVSVQEGDKVTLTYADGDKASAAGELWVTATDAPPIPVTARRFSCSGRVL